MHIYIVNQRKEILARLPDSIPPQQGSTIIFNDERTAKLLHMTPMILELEVRDVTFDYIHDSIHVKVHTVDKDSKK